MLANKSLIAGRIIGLIKRKAGTPFNASKIKSGHPLNILATIPATLPDSSSPQLLKKVLNRDLEGYFAYLPFPKIKKKRILSLGEDEARTTFANLLISQSGAHLPG